MRRTLIAFIVLASLLAAAPRAEAVLDLDFRYWYTELDSTVKSSTGSVIGNEINFANTLGIDEHKSFFDGRATLEFGHHSIRYAFIPMDWDGVKTLSASTPVTFGGRSFTALDTMDSEITINYHRLTYRYDFFDLLDNKIGAIFEVKYFDADATIKDLTIGVSETEKIDIPLPAVGIGAQAALPLLFSVSGELTGIAISSDIYIVDGEAMINIAPMPLVKFSGGYRYLRLHYDRDNDLTDFTISGPFINLRADF